MVGKGGIGERPSILSQEDIFNAALDFIFAATFSLEAKDSILGADLQQLEGNRVDAPYYDNEPVEFEEAPHPPVFKAILTLTTSLEVSVKSPFPRLFHSALRQLPYMRRAKAHKEEFMRAEIDSRVKQISAGDKRRSALDDILQRELAASKKDNRAPAYHSRAVYDEVRYFPLQPDYN